MGNFFARQPKLQGSQEEMAERLAALESELISIRNQLQLPGGNACCNLMFLMVAIVLCTAVKCGTVSSICLFEPLPRRRASATRHKYIAVQLASLVQHASHFYDFAHYVFAHWCLCAALEGIFLSGHCPASGCA